MYVSLGLRACGVGFEPAVTNAVQDCFRLDRPCEKIEKRRSQANRGSACGKGEKYNAQSWVASGVEGEGDRGWDVILLAVHASSPPKVVLKRSQKLLRTFQKAMVSAVASAWSHERGTVTLRGVFPI